MMNSSSVVVDSSTCLFIVLDNPLASQIASRWQNWIRADVKTCAPSLWQNEVTSALHKVAMQKLVSEERAYDALEAILGLGVELVMEDNELCQNAFAWATRLGQLAAYDGFYLALAERLGVEFWTADRRLVDRCHQLGSFWVHWVGE